MHHLVTAAKGMFVLASGVATSGVIPAAIAGVMHGGVTPGQMLAGGGGIILGLAILKGAAEVGRLRQMVDNHEGRISRIEKNEDSGR